MSGPISKDQLDLAAARCQKLRRKLIPLSLQLQTSCNPLQLPSFQLPLCLLELHGLLRLPVEDPAWSGGAFKRKGGVVPVLNTARPRVEQYFTAWALFYEVLYGSHASDFLMGPRPTMENLPPWCFASLPLEGLPLYFASQGGAFLPRVFRCMAVYRAPFPAVLLRLYEHAWETGNEPLQEQIRQNYDLDCAQLPQAFRDMGLDDALVCPSNQVDLRPIRALLSDKQRLEELDRMEQTLKN